MKILIKVTKEILERSAMCGVRDWGRSTTCAVAVAVRDLFPAARIGYPSISFDDGLSYYDKIMTPEMASFIGRFDDSTPEERRAMSPISFEIDVPSEVIEKIGLQEVYKILSESRTLELVAI